MKTPLDYRNVTNRQQSQKNMLSNNGNNIKIQL